MISQVWNQFLLWIRKQSTAIKYCLYLLIGSSYVVRIWQVYSYNPMQNLWSDPLRHWAHASQTLNGGPMVFFDPVGYQIWLSFIQKMSNGDSLLIVFYVSLLSCLTPWLWYRALCEIVRSRLLCLSGWALLSWSPSWIVIFSYFMTETLFLPLLGLSLWATFRANRKQTLRAFNVATFCWSIAILTRPIAAPMACVALFISWLKHPNKIKSMISGLIIVGIFFIPVGYRNYHSIGLWSPLGNGWMNMIYVASGKKEIRINLQRNGARWMYVFQCPSIGTKPFAPFSDWSSKRDGIVIVNADFANHEKDWQDSLKNNRIEDNSWIHLENLAYLFFGPSWPDSDSAQLMARAGIIERWIWLPLLMVLFVFYVINGKKTLQNPIQFSLLTIWLIFQGLLPLAVNEGRYRKPAEGIIILEFIMLFEKRRLSICHKL